MLCLCLAVYKASINTQTHTHTYHPTLAPDKHCSLRHNWYCPVYERYGNGEMMKYCMLKIIEFPRTDKEHIGINYKLFFLY